MGHSQGAGRKGGENGAARLRGYCRVCNRYYFYRRGMDTGTHQVQQHHSGVCQSCGYDCARIATRAKKPDP